MPKKGSGGGASFKRVLMGVGIVAIAGYLAISTANKIMSRAFELAFDDIETQRKGAWFTWDGDLRADSVVLYLDENATQVVRFRRAHLETPGWFWLARTAFHPKRREAELSRMRLTFSEGTFDTTETVWLYELDPLSLDTGTLFPAMGCAKHADFRHAQLAALGLSPGPLSLEFDYRVEGGKVLRTITLDNPGVARTRYERTEGFANVSSSTLVDNFVNALQLDSLATQVHGENYQIEDAGFVQARNAFCAKEDGVDIAQFQQRHLDTITRFLDVGGIAVDAASMARYATFARDGGTLSLDIRYREPIDVVDYHMGEEPAAGIAGVDVTLGIGAQRGTVVLQSFAPRPLAGFDTSDTPTWVLVERERALAAPVATAATAAPPATSDAQRGVYKVFADPLAPKAAAPGPEAPAVASAAPAATTPGTPTPTPPPAAATSPVAATPAATAPAAAVASAPAPAPVRDLAWSDLARFKGERLRVWTKQSPPRNVELIEVGATQIRVKALLGGGHAQYSISRQSFSRARRIE